MSDGEKTVQERLNAAVEDETLRGWRLMGEAADLIETLTRERDEAREELARITEFYREMFNEYSEKLSDEVCNVNQLIEERDQAEARGYRRGVQDAIEAGDKMAKEGTYGWVWLRSAILALLEQKGE